MRPNISDLLDAINRSIMSVSMPIVQRSGDMQALWETAISTRLMSYVQKRWKNEFGRLARDNMLMESLLKNGAAALKEAGSDRARELEEIVSRSRCEIDRLPSIEELEKANQEMKRGLEVFIIAHSEMGGDAPALRAARAQLREFLKEVALRDFEAAQELIFF